MATEGKVHGGSNVWATIKSALPFGGQKPFVSAPPVPSKTSSENNKRLDVQASSAVLDRSAISDNPNSGDHAAPEDRAAQNAAPQPSAAPTFGYSRNLEKRFRIEREIARGGNGIVFLVTDLNTGQEWAMKSIPKVLSDPKLSDRKRQDHANAANRGACSLSRLATIDRLAPLPIHLLGRRHCGGNHLHLRNPWSRW